MKKIRLSYFFGLFALTMPLCLSLSVQNEYTATNATETYLSRDYSSGSTLDPDSDSQLENVTNMNINHYTNAELETEIYGISPMYTWESNNWVVFSVTTKNSNYVFDSLTFKLSNGRFAYYFGSEGNVTSFNVANTLTGAIEGQGHVQDIAGSSTALNNIEVDMSTVVAPLAANKLYIRMQVHPTGGTSGYDQTWSCWSHVEVVGSEIDPSAPATSYSINYNVASHVTLTANGYENLPTSAESYTSITYNVSIDPAYNIGSVIVNGNTVTLNNNSFTTSIVSDTTIEITESLIPSTGNIITTGNYSIDYSNLATDDISYRSSVYEENNVSIVHDTNENAGLGTTSAAAGHVVYRFDIDNSKYFDSIKITGNARIFSFEGSTAKIEIYVWNQTGSQQTDHIKIAEFDSTDDGSVTTPININKNVLEDDALKILGKQHSLCIQFYIIRGANSSNFSQRDWVIVKNMSIEMGIKEVGGGDDPVDPDDPVVTTIQKNNGPALTTFLILGGSILVVTGGIIFTNKYFKNKIKKFGRKK